MSRSQHILWRNLHLRQLFCTYVNAAYIELFSRVIFSGSTSTYGYIIGVMPPHQFVKQYSESYEICVCVFTSMMGGYRYSYYFQT